jgi:hypothetical protein
MGKPANPKTTLRSRAMAQLPDGREVLASQIRDVGVAVVLERLSEVLPRLPGTAPPRNVLTKEQTTYLEAALVRDMGTEKPIVRAWPQWLKAKARFHQVNEVIVGNIMEKHFTKLQKATKSYDYQQTQTVAEALGVDRVKVIAKFNELLDAERPMYRRVFDGPDDRVGHEICVMVPDLRTQTEAAKALLGLYGKEPPSQHVHEVGITEDLKELTEAELKAEYARITLEAHKLGFGKVRESEAIEGAITPS